MGDNEEPADNFVNLNIDADVIEKYLKLESRRSNAWANQSNSGSNAKANSRNTTSKEANSKKMPLQSSSQKTGSQPHK